MQRKVVRLLATLGVAAAVFAASPSVEAATIIFDNASNHTGGTITATSGAGGVSLTQGRIDLVGNLDNSVFFPVSGACGTYGCLTVQTGAFIGPGLAANSYVYSGVGSSISITGTAGGANGVLYSGVFDPLLSVVLQIDNLNTGLGSLSGTLASGALHPILAAALGSPVNVMSGTDTNNFIRFTFTGAPPNGTGSVTTNTVQLVTAAPEPATMGLFGLALLGLGGAVRRRFTA